MHNQTQSEMIQQSLLLYAVTDRSWLNGETLDAQVEQALRGGVTLVQLREKQLPEEDFLTEAIRMKELCAHYGVPLIINDNVEVALQSGADGVHIGQSDMGAVQARRLLGPDKILGVSARTLEQARLAEEQGADYIGVGAVFATSTKLDAQPVSRQELKNICANISIPAVAIGGIGRDNIATLAGSGIAGIAVVSAIFAQPDIQAAAGELRLLAQKAVES